MTQVEKAPATTANPVARLRITYARGEALRYVSHLDMQMVWERTLRRAGLPIAFSQGFNPRPRLHLACALPLGFLSRHELTDIWVVLGDAENGPDLPGWFRRIQAAAPPGLNLLHAEIAPLQLPALQTQVQSAEYLAVPLDALDETALRQSVAGLLAAETLPRERRNKPYDLRPLIERLEVQPGETGPVLFMRLSARESATGRPEEVLSALGFDPPTFRVERTMLVLAE